MPETNSTWPRQIVKSVRPARSRPWMARAMTSASAKAVGDFAESRQPGYPLDKGGSGGGKKVNRESIESIKDPAKRIMARAAHMDLYK